MHGALENYFIRCIDLLFAHPTLKDFPFTILCNMQHIVKTRLCKGLR